MLPYLCERLRGGKSHGLVCTQFLCALNIQLGGDPNLSKDAMSEFYYNLLMQALSKSNHKILLNISETSDLAMNINYIIQNKTYKFKEIEQETKQDELKKLKSDFFFIKKTLTNLRL